jgi:hypothetical protein
MQFLVCAEDFFKDLDSHKTSFILRLCEAVKKLKLSSQTLESCVIQSSLCLEIDMVCVGECRGLGGGGVESG